MKLQYTCGCEFDGALWIFQAQDCLLRGECAERAKLQRLNKETLYTDPVTGGQKGVKLAMLGALDPGAIMEIAKVAGFGAGKYARYNFLKGYNYSLSYDALQRHLHAWWSRENKDEESGLSHLAHAAWHCLALLAFQMHGLGTDDRWKK